MCLFLSLPGPRPGSLASRVQSVADKFEAKEVTPIAQLVRQKLENILTQALCPKPEVILRSG